MIVFNLNCSDCDSSFEGWFESSNDYMKQKRQKVAILIKVARPS